MGSLGISWIRRYHLCILLELQRIPDHTWSPSSLITYSLGLVVVISVEKHDDFKLRPVSQVP